MDGEPGGTPIDERELRVAQAAIGVLLLAAFVFRVPSLVVGVAFVVAIGAVFGARWNGFHAVYRALVGPRMRPPVAVVPPEAVRVLDGLAAVLLLLASATFLVGIDLIGWFLALVEAAVAIVEATTGYNAALDLYHRARRGR
jgi:hypothetical protein